MTFWWVGLHLPYHLLASDQQTGISPFRPAHRHLPQTTIFPWPRASVSFSVAAHVVLKHCALTVSPCSRNNKNVLNLA